MKRHDTLDDQLIAKRARHSDAPPLINQANIQSQSIPQSIPPIFQYTFVRDVVMSMLDDVDVLSRLFITGKSVRAWYASESTSQSVGYEIKRNVRYSMAATIVSHPLTPKLDIRHLSHVTSTDFSAFPRLTNIEFDIDHIPVNSIPHSVQKVDFGLLGLFNQPLDEILPPSLTSLSLGSWFNQPIAPGIIPSTVTNLDLGYSFNQPLLHGALPASLQQLHFPFLFNQPLHVGVIPNNVRTISFKDIGCFNQPLLPGMFPSSLRELNYLMGSESPLEAGVLPEGLESLLLVCFPSPFKPGCLPNSLTTLVINESYEHEIPLGVFPLNGNLKSIVMEQLIRETFEPGFFPNGLVHLQFVNLDAPLLPGVLPPCLTHLDLGSRFNHVLLPGSLPASLLHLVLGPEFDQTLLPGVIPQGVVKLSFGEKYNRRIPRGSIPSSVKYVCMAP